MMIPVFRSKVKEHEIMDGIKALGLEGACVCLHSSLRSFRANVADGPHTIIRSFRQSNCTLMVPTFSFAYLVPPPSGMNYRQNGRYSHCPPVTPRPEGFSRDSVYLDRQQMGAIPAAVLQEKDRLRGNHPLCSFSAIGPYAGDLIHPQAPLDVYAPFARLCELDGFVLLMGVELDRCTIIHYAEKLAGINLMRRWARLADGSIVETENGSCSSGFNRLFSVLEPACRTHRVRGSLWLCFRAKEIVQLATVAIRANRLIRHCGYSRCVNCNDITAGGPILNAMVPFQSSKR
ncbi:MAG: aminoglycoside N(3)-acetyltransferase [Lentisphaerae bacterium]|nr:MAG: aminoglycoside N(3)-acetyltransferase [Lentisphaerota bacterium]